MYVLCQKRNMYLLDFCMECKIKLSYSVAGYQSYFKNELINIHYKYSCLPKGDMNIAVFGERIE